MNSDADKLWSRVAKFQQVEESSWRILAPLLDGTTSLSHIDGSLYSPQVPEVVCKAHAATINKVHMTTLTDVLLLDKNFGFSLLWLSHWAEGR